MVGGHISPSIIPMVGIKRCSYSLFIVLVNLYRTADCLWVSLLKERLQLFIAVMQPEYTRQVFVVAFYTKGTDFLFFFYFFFF